MLTVEIVNDGTGTLETGNYRYRALVNGQEIASGEVKGHFRPAGWESLLAKVANKASLEKSVRSMQAFADACRRLAEMEANPDA